MRLLCNSCSRFDEGTRVDTRKFLLLESRSSHDFCVIVRVICYVFVITNVVKEFFQVNMHACTVKMAPSRFSVVLMLPM